MFKKSCLTFIALTFLAGGLAGCTEAQYASHVIKQIPMPGDQPRSIGYYKVGSSYKIKGKRYHPKSHFKNYTETGKASWYGPNFHGKLTANGEIFNKYDLTAAHRTLQMPSIIRVTNLKNGRTVILRVNDRGPFAHNRVLDVSERGAELLGFKKYGTAQVRIEVLEQPSREVAAMAKQRIDTTGYEVALNNDSSWMSAPANMRAPSRSQSSQPQPSTQLAQVAAPQMQTPAIKPPAKIATRSIVPPSVPSTRAVTSAPTSAPQITPAANEIPIYTPSNFFVQAGAFANEKNALNYQRLLSSYGNSSVFLSRETGAPVFRVKLGPYDSEENAVQVLSQLQSAGKSGIVIAE